MSDPTKEPATEWAKNLADNEKSGEDARRQMWDAIRELKLEELEVDRRWQSANPSDLKNWRGMYFILTGKPYPDKKGYMWA